MRRNLLLIAPLAVALAACSSASGAAPSWTFAPAAQAPAAQAPVGSSAPSSAPSSADTSAGGMMGGGSGMMGSGSGMMGAPATPAASTPAATTPAAATRIDVTLTDAMRIEPAAMTVPAGVPITFVVTNTGTVLHEFTLGDAAEQDAHDREMAEAGGMSMPADEPNAIGVMPGQTKTLVFTFEAPGDYLAGCHVVGHYAAGMRSAITVD